jgi:hypothetical protein
VPGRLQDLGAVDAQLRVGRYIGFEDHVDPVAVEMDDRVGVRGAHRVGLHVDAGLLFQLARRALGRPLTAVEQPAGQRPARAGRLAEQEDAPGLGGVGVADDGHRAEREGGLERAYEAAPPATGKPVEGPVGDDAQP